MQVSTLSDSSLPCQDKCRSVCASRVAYRLDWARGEAVEDGTGDSKRLSKSYGLGAGAAARGRVERQERIERSTSVVMVAGLKRWRNRATGIRGVRRGDHLQVAAGSWRLEESAG